MSLCPSCRAIRVSTLIGDLEHVPSWWLEAGQSNDTVKPKGMIHLQDARQLPISAAAGCPLCGMILDAVPKHSQEGDCMICKGDRREGVFQHGTCLIDGPVYLQPNFNPLKRAFPERTVKGAPYVRGFRALIPVQQGYLTAQIRLFAPRDSSAALSCDVVGRPPLPSSDSPEAFDLINRWMSRCLGEHEQCKESFSGTVIDESRPRRLPTRVVRVGHANDEVPPRLFETEGKSGHYLALSHCWGPHKPPLMTTQSTLEQHITGISWNEIPKVYQDAMTVTYRLGFEYLWIDSLCIIQDSTSDWLNESKQMGAVYENARLTIAASHASGSSQPCFIARPQLPVVVELPYITRTGANAGSIFATPMPVDYTSMSPEHSPLDKRAWATQEWLLSRRMVFYTAESLVWSCKSISQRETGGSFHSTARNPRWKAIVEKYSARALTQASDRLIALEGLRIEMGKKMLNDTYCFGLWKHSMPDQLLWVCKSPAERLKSPLCLPTWSWASTTKCGVRFLDIKNAKNACGGFRFDAANNTLVIRGALKKASLTSHVCAVHGFVPGRLASNMVCGICCAEEGMGSGILDEDEEEIPTADIFSLQLMSGKVTEALSGTQVKYYKDWVLLLQKLNSYSDTYVRIGAGTISRTAPTTHPQLTDVYIL